MVGQVILEEVTFERRSGGQGASQVTLMVKNPPANAGDIRDVGSIPRLGRPLEKVAATHSSILG